MARNFTHPKHLSIRSGKTGGKASIHGPPKNRVHRSLGPSDKQGIPNDCVHKLIPFLLHYSTPSRASSAASNAAFSCDGLRRHRIPHPCPVALCCMLHPSYTTLHTPEAQQSHCYPSPLPFVTGFVRRLGGARDGVGPCASSSEGETSKDLHPGLYVLKTLPILAPNSSSITTLTAPVPSPSQHQQPSTCERLKPATPAPPQHQHLRPHNAVPTPLHCTLAGVRLLRVHLRRQLLPLLLRKMTEGAEERGGYGGLRQIMQ